MEKKDLYKVAIVEPKFKREEIFNKITENYCSNMITKIGNPQLLLFNIYQKSKTKSITINKHEKIMTIFSNIARKSSIYISPGVLIENIKGNVLPTAYLFNPEGELILKQREIFTLSLEKNLSKEDKNNLNKKNIKLNVVDTELGKLGFIINNDCFYPEIARFLSLKGVDIVLAVNNIIDD
ncbi:MAG: nitrilase-related carbon-nitrogen hydrolase, partial [Halanaerobiales bacterium]